MNTMLLAIVVAFLICPITSHPMHEFVMETLAKKPMKDRFKFWWHMNSRPYDLNTDEGLMRYKIFKSNVKFIEESNKKNDDFKLSVGPFTDLTFEEFKSRYSHENKDQDRINSEISQIRASGIPEKDYTVEPDIYSMDWSNYLNPVRDEKGCSTGNFPIFEAVEFYIRRKEFLYVQLAPQVELDCSYAEPCKNTSFVYLFKHVMERGLFNEDQFPYTGVKGECKVETFGQHECEKLNPTVIFDSYDVCEKYGTQCTDDKIEKIIKDGVYVTSLKITPELQHWSSGVYEYKCFGSGDYMNLLIVKANFDHFVGRASFGTTWGEQGKIKIVQRKYAKKVDRFELDFCGPQVSAGIPVGVKKFPGRINPDLKAIVGN
jgi:hypothetical protein